MQARPYKISDQTSLSELISIIEGEHHAFTRAELDRIATMLGDAELATMPALDEVRHCVTELQADLMPHLLKEEHILFPYITALESDPENPPSSCFGSIANPIRMMQLEHASMRSLLEKLRALTAQYRPAPDSNPQVFLLYAALAGFDADLVQHIHWEDAVLFPRALQMESQSAR